jgi:hypothetical protein
MGPKKKEDQRLSARSGSQNPLLPPAKAGESLSAKAITDATALEFVKTQIKTMIREMQNVGNRAPAEMVDQRLSPANPVGLFNFNVLEMKASFSQSIPDSLKAVKLRNVMKTFAKPDLSVKPSLPHA